MYSALVGLGWSNPLAKQAPDKFQKLVGDAIVYFQAAQLAEAEGAYRALLKLRPDDTAALNNLAELYQHGGERDKACALYTDALKAKPDFHMLRANRAICRRPLASCCAQSARSVPQRRRGES